MLLSLFLNILSFIMLFCFLFCLFVFYLFITNHYYYSLLFGGCLFFSNFLLHPFFLIGGKTRTSCLSNSLFAYFHMENIIWEYTSRVLWLRSGKCGSLMSLEADLEKGLMGAGGGQSCYIHVYPTQTGRATHSLFKQSWL